MQTTETHSLDRLMTRHDLMRGTGLRMFLWGIGAGLLILPLVLSLLYLLQLVQSHGTLTATAEEWPAVVQTFSLQRDVEVRANARVVLDGAGLVPTAWYTRGTATGELAGWLVRNIPSMRNNRGAALTLIVILGVSLLVFFFCLERQLYHQTRLVRETQARARRMIHRQSLRLGQSDLQGTINSRAGDLFDDETNRLGQSLEMWLEIRSRLVPVAGGLLAAGLLVDWLLFLLCLLPLEAGWLIWQQISRKAKQDHLEAEAIAGRDLQLLKSGLKTARIVRGFGMQEFEQNQFQKLIDDYHLRQSNVLASRRWSIRGTAILGLILVLAVFFVLATKILSGTVIELAFARSLVVLAVIGGISVLLKDFSRVSGHLELARTAAAKIFRFLDESPLVGQAVGAKFLPPVTRSIYFESVTYAPPGKREPLLERLDLKLEAGKVNVLISLDPEVARAFAWLLPRFVEPQGGRILFDGEDIAWATLESLRAETILVTGNDPVLNGSVLENLTGEAREYSLQDATDAAKLARAHSFISRLPQGYETQLGVYGETLDAGQRFRLSLARAILRKPAVLIVEEPREQLDEDTKTLLDDAYQRLFDDRTVIVIPSRLSTVKKADQVIVLHNGRVEAIGTHANLVKSNEIVRHWEYTHFNPFRGNGVKQVANEVGTSS